ncbi:Na(+)-translocating NADH-quinone reductase subunit A [Spongiivirga citrea]|uniref:Na(+)-translocating NADH-quinone reductase subunit A n=1 Tax=Spongiivirga citrea TaxID=1481457 RepID=A0A6M0CNW3_9FLAO|nr:Na(+)-translocating NADH-quinone reductase subunit A [Spongiivirga citrea]NER18633.1 Na(+)-translocating NADH-quinone reductase subunit A [Spongiivirga citrea]
MSKDIRIKRGLNIKLKGQAEKVLSDAPKSQIFAIKPTDFHTVMPKMVVKEGQSVKQGEVLFYSKYSDKIKFTAPVSGVVKEIVRGAKRRILEVRVEADGKNINLEHGSKNPEEMSGEEVKDFILESGCWPFIKQRPYDVIANPDDKPKAIFISAYSTAPLAADVEFVLNNEEEAFQAGINAIAKLTEGKTHLSVDKTGTSFLNNVQNVEVHRVSGPHPAGNVGVQIHHIDPINAGERVWVINPADVIIIGRLFLNGAYDPSRVIAVAGSSVKNPKYYKTKIGAQISTFIYDAGVENPESIRMINGDVLTGEEVQPDNFLGFYNSTFTVIPEGNKYRMFGWLPFVGNSIPSMSRTSFAFLFKNKEFEVDTNLNGEERALVVTGEMEKVMPMDIYPMQLIKECMAGNIEKMENLGIYEVAPEDFALVDYASTSKIEAQAIIRQGLDIMIEEVG